MMAHNAAVHTHTLTKSLLGHFILSVCGLFLCLSAILLFLQKPIPVVTLAAANKDPNKYG